MEKDFPQFFSVFFNLEVRNEDRITQDRDVAKEKVKEDSFKKITAHKCILDISGQSCLAWF